MATDLAPSCADLEDVFRMKHGDPAATGPGPRRRHRSGYFTPDDHYEALVARLVAPGCAWVDVGGGRELFPTNPALARQLADRAALLVGVDPSANIDENPYVHERVRSTIEEFDGGGKFDLATLRMVAEHIAAPERAVAALCRALRPGGRAVVYTINRWTPVALASWLIPFGLHHPIKRLLWQTEEKDTFPVAYRMNTRRALRDLFAAQGMTESTFVYLDDCRSLARFGVLNALELRLWGGLRRLGCRYPENCLLGVYEKSGEEALPETANRQPLSVAAPSPR